jgi:hypothetical protein
MSPLAICFGVILILIVLWDAFETVVLPRRVTRRFRLVRLFYRISWPLWSEAVRMFAPRRRRENFLSYFGPLSLPLLLALWAFVLIVGFALLYLSQDHAVKTPEGVVRFADCLYFSGTTFFTLGLGDIVPLTGFARALIVVEAGMGFGFLAIIISYLPAMNASFSRREVNISLLDARAGSPPTAAEILRRHMHGNAMDALARLLHEWERWSADLLESHLSFPVLVYFRSQHDNQSWLAALTSILDTCAFVIAHLEGECVRQAQLTFSMARHAVVDLALVLHVPPHKLKQDRLPEADLASLMSLLAAEGLRGRRGPDKDEKLKELRIMYEPYVFALSKRLLLPLPPWLGSSIPDNWQVSAWGRSAGFMKEETAKQGKDRHF